MTGPAGPVGVLLSYGAYPPRGRLDRAVLSTVVTWDDWPPQRAVAGFDLPFRTPVANLWNVGDGVKEYANGGTTACAETAKLVADQIAARFPLAAEPEEGI
jgi:phytoene desaturase